MCAEKQSDGTATCQWTRAEKKDTGKVMIDYDDILMHSPLTSMSKNDLELLYSTASEISPKSILEIGARNGCSSSLLGIVAKEKSGHLYSIEPSPQQLWKKNIDRLGLGEYVTQIVGASPWIQVERVGQPIDFFLIDGDHRTRWCLADYHYWSVYVRRGGRIAFHDWCGANGIAAQVRQAVEIILKTDALTEVGRAEGKDKGLIVFEKSF